MDLEQLRECMRKVLVDSRFRHSIGVEEVACDLATIFGYDSSKACVAGILHDCAKNLSDEELLNECCNYHLPVTEIERSCAFLLHAKVGAAFARDKYSVKDEDILSAITYHTTGRPGMTLLEKIIFTADYIEPYRKPLPRIKEIRWAAYNDLNLAVLMILENTLDYLRTAASRIDMQTVETYEYYNEMRTSYVAE